MATVVTTLNYLDGVMAGNVLMDNGGYKSITHTPAIVTEAYTDFTGDGTFTPQGGSSNLTALIVAGGGGGGRRQRLSCGSRRLNGRAGGDGRTSGGRGGAKVSMGRQR